MIFNDNSFDAIETTCNILSNETEAVSCSCELGSEIFLLGIS